MPRVEIVQKHNTAARRLYIRGHNGKIYPYLVMNDACLTESRREERVLQLLRLLNPCLEKRKETTKRHLFFTGMAMGDCVHEVPKGTRDEISPGICCFVFHFILPPHQFLIKKIEKYLLFTHLFLRDLSRNTSSAAVHWEQSAVTLSFHLFCLSHSTHTISICFQVLFPLLSFPGGLPPPRCLPALQLCIDWFV